MEVLGFLESIVWDEDGVRRLMQRVAEAALVLADGAEGAAVELVDDDGFLNYTCASGLLSPHVGLRLPASGSFAGLAAASGNTLACEDAETDPRVDLEACRRLGVTSMVCVPLWRGRSVIGVLEVAAGRRAAFDDATVGLLGGLGEFIGAAVSGASEVAMATSQLLSTRSSPDWYGARPGRVDAVAEFVENVMPPMVVGDAATYRRVNEIIEQRQFNIVCQPIVDLETGRPVSFEALTRFSVTPYRPPDKWFADAHATGMGVLLELATAAESLELVERLPSDVSLAVNVGPAVAASDAFAALVEAAGPERVVIELTEHAAVEDYPSLVFHLEPLRRAGARLAVDDTGAGISSLTHIVKLAPDVIKLDRFLTTGIDVDPVRRALAGALVSFARETGAEVVAEGIENDGQLAALRQLGITFGQGYHIGKPAPLSQFVECSQPVR